MENMHTDVRVKMVNSAPKILNSVGEKESSWNILFQMKLCWDVSCDCNDNVSEATITITFPCKQTMMKHDMD